MSRRLIVVSALVVSSLVFAHGALAQSAPSNPNKPAPAKPADATAAPTTPNDADLKAQMEAYAAMMKPTAEHKALEALMGEWDMVTRAWVSPTAAPIEMKATVKKSMDMGGRFLREDVTGADPTGQPYTGVGYLGFDPGAKQYQGVWISSNNAAMIVYSGKANPDGKSFAFTGRESDPTGGAALDFKMTVTIDSPDKHTLVFNYLIPNAGELKAFEIVHTRKK